MTNGSEAPPGPGWAHHAPPVRPSDGWVAGALALLLGLQPVTTDLYLPTLPDLSAEFGGAMAAAQMTLSGLYVAFGFGQLLMGPLSDRHGRRPVLLGGLILYVVATLLSMTAASIEALIGFRVLQGLGMAAATVCARAMVRDLFAPVQGAAMLSRGLSGLGVIALASPLLGGFIASAGGWRAAMGACAMFAAVALGLVTRRLPETRSTATAQAFDRRQIAATWWRIARHRSFIAWCLLTAFTFCGLLTFLASSSFVYIEVLGTSPLVYGTLVMTASGTFLIGTLACRRLLPRLGMTGSVAVGAGFTLAGGLSMAGLALAGVHEVWALCLPQMLFMFGHGIHQPIGMAGVAGPFPEHAGAASALAGFVMSVMSVGVGLWLGVALNGTVYPMAFTLAFFAVLTSTVAWTLVPRWVSPKG